MREIPYVIVESMLTRLERTLTKLWIVILILIVLLVGSNIAWLYYESQFETTEITQDVDTGNGDNTTVIGIGDHKHILVHTVMVRAVKRMWAEVPSNDDAL